MLKNYDEWFDEYFSDLINIFKIFVKHTNIEDNNNNFNDFCILLYKN